MKLVKLSLSERILRAAKASHGLRLNNTSAASLVETYLAKGVAVPPRFEHALSKNTGLRLDRHDTQDVKVALGLSDPA